MMYKYLLSVLLASSLVAFSTTTQAQPRPRQTPAKPATKQSTPEPDLLGRRDGTELEVLVTEITDKEIVYKRFSNPDGPNFRVQKADFSYLKYGRNGEIEQFTAAVPPAPRVAPPAPAPTRVTPPTQADSFTPAPAHQAQRVATSEGLRFGFKGGIQSASMAISNFSGDIKGILGYQVGLMLDRPIGSTARVRGQLLYSGKGCEPVNSNPPSISVNYIEVPVDVLFKIPTSNGQFLLGGGWYLGYALSGKWGAKDATIGSAQTDYFTTFDTGLRLSGWYDLSSGLTLNAFYSVGLANINPTVGQNTFKNRTFGIGVGYFLSRK